LCRRAGIPDDVYFSALVPNVAHSGVSDLKGPKLRQRDYSAQFSLKNMTKDLRMTLETATEFSLLLEQTGHLKNIYDQGIAAGWSDDDFIGLMRLLDKKA
jgi:3-hydroxyisobutyrate dehydrogenase-like beta-hydroxyacid dehydrogenase